MKTLPALLLCLAVFAGRAHARDPQDGALVDCGPEKVAVFEGSVSPDGHYAFGWTFRPARNQKPVDWTAYDSKHLSEWIIEYLPPPDGSDPDYQLLNGVLDLRAKKFLPLACHFPYWPNKNHGDMSVAWSHGSQPGKFAVVRNDARFDTMDLWLIETGGDPGVRVVNLTEPAGKSVRQFLRQRLPKKYDAMAVTYGDVSFNHGEAMIDFSAEIPKSEDDSTAAAGTVSVALPAGTITGVKAKGR